MPITSFEKKFKTFIKTIAGLIFLTALVHMTLSQTFENSRDIIFSICLLVNTLLMTNVLINAEKIMAKKEKTYDVMVIFNLKQMIIFGLAYGIFIGITPFIISFGTSNFVLKISTAAFLFLHNFLTGMCVSPLIHFFKQLFQNKKHYEVKLWDRSNPELKAHFKIYETLIIHVTAICSLAITAAFMSFFILENYAWIFSLICAIFMLSAYFLPQYPIIKSLKMERQEKIEEINKLIQNEFDTQLTQIGIGKESDVKKLENLQFFKSIVVETTSHFSTIEKRTKGFVSVIFLSAFPTIIKCLFDQFLKTQ